MILRVKVIEDLKKKVKNKTYTDKVLSEEVFDIPKDMNNLGEWKEKLKKYNNHRLESMSFGLSKSISIKDLLEIERTGFMPSHFSAMSITFVPPALEKQAKKRKEGKV